MGSKGEPIGVRRDVTRSLIDRLRCHGFALQRSCCVDEDAGIKQDYDMSTWHGTFAPKSTPAEITDFLNEEIKITMAKEKVRQAAAAQGFPSCAYLTRKEGSGGFRVGEQGVQSATSTNCRVRYCAYASPQNRRDGAPATGRKEAPLSKGATVPRNWPSARRAVSQFRPTC
jgi:hypothetical protein